MKSLLIKLKIISVVLLAGVALAISGLPQTASAAESFRWSGNNIVGSGDVLGGGATFRTSGGNYVYQRGAVTNRGPCNGAVTFTISGVSGNRGTIATQYPTGIACGEVLAGPVTIGGTQGAAATGEEGEEKDLCIESSTEMGWFMCPIIKIAASAAQRLDCIVLNILIIDTDPIFGGQEGVLDNNPSLGQCLVNAGAELPENTNVQGGNPDSSKGFHTAWGVFRNISYALLLIFGLVMIISQILGFELFDAYTIRKMLPRLIAAVIFIALSWNIMNFLFNASNDAAFALGDLIKAPFRGLSAGDAVDGGDITLAFLILNPLTLTAGAGAAVVFAFALGIGGVLALIFTVLLAVFSAFVLLAARNVVAYMLIIAAPLAIICAAFKPFEKVFSLWKTLLITILLSVPAIAAIIAISHVGALIAFLGSSPIATLSAIAILIAGYALIWSVFKKLDSVAGQLGNVVSSATGGIQKRLAGYRGKKMKENFGKMASGDRFKGSNALTRAFNSASQGVGFGWQGRFGLGARGSAMRDLRSRQAATEAGKNPLLQEGQFDDDGIAALYLSAGQSARRASRELRRLNPTWSGERVRRAVASAEAMGINRSNAIAAGSLAADNKFRSLGFGQAASDAIATTNATIAGGSLDSRGEFVGGDQQLFGNLEGGIRWHARTHGATHVADRTLAGAWDRTSMQELGASTPPAKEAFLRDITTRLTSADEGERQRASVQALEMHQLLSQGTDAGSQAALIAAEQSWGFGDAQRQAVSFEEFLSQRFLGTGAAANGGTILRSQARTWDSQSDADLARYRGLPNP